MSVSWGEFKELEKAQETQSGSSWDIADIGNTANSWLGTLANTVKNYQTLEDTINRKDDDATQQAYSDITNSVPTEQYIGGIDNSMLIYGGVAVVALFFAMGGD